MADDQEVDSEADDDDEADEEGDVDWEGLVESKTRQLRGLLMSADEGMHQDDDDLICHLLTRRKLSAQTKAGVLAGWLAHVVQQPAEADVEYKSSQKSDEDAGLEEAMDADALSGVGSPTLSSPRLNESTPTKELQGSPTAFTPPGATPPIRPSPLGPGPARPSSSTAATSAPAHRPARKAAAGKQAQEQVQQSEKLRKRHNAAGANEMLGEQIQAGGSPISSPYAQRQARQLADLLYPAAGSAANAKKVLAKFAKLPDVRALVDFAEDPRKGLMTRLVDNAVTFFADHLVTRGSRTAADQNIFDAILAALVDPDMAAEQMINSVAGLLGVRWAAVKTAVETRLKLDQSKLEEEETVRSVGIWQQKKRSERSDKYKLPGFYAFQHDETFFRFSSRRSSPLRLHVGVKEYQIHWAREVPNMLKDVVDMYLGDPRAEKYRAMDRAQNGNNLPERTTLHDNICFCLVKPTRDQCADPVYTMLRANLPTWHKLRSAWHKESDCDDSCACKEAWFRAMTQSEAALDESVLCKPCDEKELTIDDDNGAAPKLHKPTCTRGECEDPSCLKTRLEQLGACMTEFKASADPVRFRKYAKMERTRNDGSPYTEVEFVYVEEPRAAFVQTMLSAIEAYTAHKGAHLWAVRQRKLVIEKLKEAPAFSELARKLDMSEADAMEALLSARHEHHLTVTGHDIIIFTDFAAKKKYDNFFEATCQHPEQGTMCIAVVLHSPAKRSVWKDVTEQEQLGTGLEGVAVADSSKAPQHIRLGKRQQVEVDEQTVQCDVFCAYAKESGNARFDQTFMRDIVAYFKHGHLKHATAATHRGKPVPIGADAATAKESEYDKTRLDRLAAVKAQQKKEKDAELALAREQEEAAAPAAAAPAAAAPAAAANSAPVLKKRATAGVSKRPVATAATDDEEMASTDAAYGRGTLPRMRLLIKFTDGCGVQYVQREAAHGTASLYADTEELSKQLADKAEKFGVFGVHVVFEPHCFKYIHDAAGKVFADNSDRGVLERGWTISNVEEHYDYNAATMLAPTNERFNFDFSFSEYVHVLYRAENFIDLEADAVQGIKAWRCTQGGSTSRAIGRGGAGGGLGYLFDSQPHVCFCQGKPCAHVAFTGTPTEHRVLPATQEKTDRDQATDFYGTICADMPLASQGDLEDETAGGEPLWLSIAKGNLEKNDEKFTAAGGSGEGGTRTIAKNWYYVDVSWLVKVKTDSDGNVHYDSWTQPHGERTVLTKNKILSVPINWLRVEDRRDGTKRYVMSGATYQRLLDAVK